VVTPDPQPLTADSIRQAIVDLRGTSEFSIDSKVVVFSPDQMARMIEDGKVLVGEDGTLSWNPEWRPS
jgi:hypothetical protein